MLPMEGPLVSCRSPLPRWLGGTSPQVVIRLSEATHQTKRPSGLASPRICSLVADRGISPPADTIRQHARRAADQRNRLPLAILPLPKCTNRLCLVWAGVGGRLSETALRVRSAPRRAWSLLARERSALPYRRIVLAGFPQLSTSQISKYHHSDCWRMSVLGPNFTLFRHCCEWQGRSGTAGRVCPAVQAGPRRNGDGA